MKYCITYILFFLMCNSLHANHVNNFVFFKPTHHYIQYTGRIDFADENTPRFWQPGVYITTSFIGDSCGVILQDQMRWGTNHNYIEIVIDEVATRIRLKTNRDTIWTIPQSPKKIHTITIYKNTEANIGYMELVGFLCKQLHKPNKKPKLKIECIGNSITCGTGSDVSEIACRQGVWHDQHNAYLSYGALVARNLDAQFHLSSVSGIGLMRSCCNLKITMPQMFDKINLYDGDKTWDFKNYQPNIVTICLGQNDGIVDSASFSNHYFNFIQYLRKAYPNAQFICMSSPMAHLELFNFQKNNIQALVKKINQLGDNKVSCYFFSKQYHLGCDGHPSIEEHQMIANELIQFIQKKLTTIKF